MTGRSEKIYYSEWKWYTVRQIEKLTGKSKSAIYTYLNENQNTRTIKKIKDWNRKTSACKFFIKWIPFKKWCLNNRIKYRTWLYRVHTWKIQVDT